MAYTKPVLSALSLQSESSGCCFFVTDSGQGVFIYPGDGGSTGGGQGLPSDIAIAPIGGIALPGAPGGQIATVGNGNASVTPLCGTGLPATQPIIIGAPVGVSGVRADVSSQGAAANVSFNDLGASVLGQQVL